MPANVLVEDVGAIFDGHLDAAGDRVLFVNPDADAVGQVVESLTDRDEPPRVAILAGERFLKDVLEDFLVASRVADLVEREVLTLRSIEEPPNQALLVTAEDVTALVTVDDGVGGLRTADDELVTAANDYYGTIETAATTFSLRTPPLSRVRETLATDVGEDVAADFDAVLASVEAFREKERSDDAVLDEVTISLLVAARNRELLYDVSKWGEDVGMASKATFSRTKTALEDAGLIGTEKVPIEVGRPRLRLHLGDDRLADVDPGKMAVRARQLLAD